MTNNPLPELIIGEDDYQKLTSYTARPSGAMARAAESLLEELERAAVLPQAEVPSHYVRMGSTVTFSTSDGGNRTVQLVYPEKADIARQQVSVLTPIGAALIGLHEGQSIPWKGVDRREHVLTVVKVVQNQDFPEAV